MFVPSVSEAMPTSRGSEAYELCSMICDSHKATTCSACENVMQGDACFVSEYMSVSRGFKANER